MYSLCTYYADLRAAGDPGGVLRYLLTYVRTYLLTYLRTYLLTYVRTCQSLQEEYAAVAGGRAAPMLKLAQGVMDTLTA